MAKKQEKCITRHTKSTAYTCKQVYSETDKWYKITNMREVVKTWNLIKYKLVGCVLFCALSLSIHSLFFYFSPLSFVSHSRFLLFGVSFFFLALRRAGDADFFFVCLFIEIVYTNADTCTRHTLHLIQKVKGGFAIECIFTYALRTF